MFFPGLWYACQLRKPEKAFCAAIASAVVPGRKESRAARLNKPLKFLPVLDPALASKVLLTDKFLSDRAPHVDLVLVSLNDASVAVPLDRLEILINAWGPTASSEKTEYRIRRGYRGCLTALAKHQPERAVKLAEALMKQCPGDAEQISNVYLAAAGLVSSSVLYPRHLRSPHPDDPAEFARLPRVAQYYFAISLFEGDALNGGYEQAFGNYTGDYFPIVLEGMAAIGAKNGLRYMKQLSALFGPNGPSHRLERAQPSDGGDEAAF